MQNRRDREEKENDKSKIEIVDTVWVDGEKLLSVSFVLLFLFLFFNNLNIIMTLIQQDLMVCALNIKVLNLRALRFELELKQFFMNFFLIFDALVSVIFDV